MSGRRPIHGLRFGLSPPEPKPVSANPLGLLIVLDKPGRRRPSIGRKQADGNRSDDNEASAFSYSSDTDDDSENDIWSEDRRTYLSDLNDEYLLAMSLDKGQGFRFEPCRKLRPLTPDPERKRATGMRKNVYKRAKGQDGAGHAVKEGCPSDSHHFWSRSPSWSAIGRLFGKLKHGHHRDEDEKIRKLSLQTASSAADTDDASSESIPEHRVRCSSYEDPEGFLKQVQLDLESGELGHREGISHLKVVSKNADDLQFTVTSTGRGSLAVCKEYFSRLTMSCYDSMPTRSQMVAIDTRTPMEEVFNILRRHRATGAVVWNASATSNHETSMRKLCDIGLLAHMFWPYFTDASAATGNVFEHLRRPLMDFLAWTPSGYDAHKDSEFECGVSAEVSLIEAAGLFCRQIRTNIPTKHKTQCSQHGRFGRILLPLVNETTGDVIHVLSAKDILRFLSRELCKFDLSSAFDRTTVSDMPWFKQRGSTTMHSRERDKWWLYSDYTLKQASAVLIESGVNVLPVFKHSEFSKSTFETTLSIADVVDLVAKSGYCSDAVLSKRLDELLVDRSKNDTPIFDTNTSVSRILKTLATSNSDHGNWDSLLPAAVIFDDKGDFAGFLDAEDLLTTVLLLEEQGCENGKGATKIDSHDRHDSGVGDELQFLEEAF